MPTNLVEMEYSGPDGHVQDEVAPYNDGNRRVYAGDKVAVPEDLAEYLDIFEGWNYTDSGKVGEDDTADWHARAQESIEAHQVEGKEFSLEGEPMEVSDERPGAEEKGEKGEDQSEAEEPTSEGDSDEESNSEGGK